jgi:hypothetical protein
MVDHCDLCHLASRLNRDRAETLGRFNGSRYLLNCQLAPLGVVLSLRPVPCHQILLRTSVLQGLYRLGSPLF